MENARFLKNSLFILVSARLHSQLTFSGLDIRELLLIHSFTNKKRFSKGPKRLTEDCEMTQDQRSKKPDPLMFL